VIDLAVIDKGIIAESPAKRFFIMGIEGMELALFRISERPESGKISGGQEDFTERDISASFISWLI